MIINRDSQLIEQVVNPTFANKKAHVGMPPLTRKSRALAFFEFWPSSVVYIPIVFYWLFQGLRFRGMTLPLYANPGFFLGGLVGESKADNFLQAGSLSRQYIASWHRIVNNQNIIQENTDQVLAWMKVKGFTFPIIAKPDIGCRGAGVQIIRTTSGLQEYFRVFPDKAAIIFQELIPWEAEAGIFYIRHPGESQGRIFSLTLKYQPYVYGNGVDTLRTLIHRDPRAGKIAHLYLSRHKKHLDEVLAPGQPFRLAFAGSHSRGSIFCNGNALVTPELTRVVDQIGKDIKGFYFGRIDVRFADQEALQRGTHFRIMEINGISSEAGHIWDADSSLREVYKTLFTQYRTLFEIGIANRANGHRAGTVMQLLKSWIGEIRLKRHYPETE